MHVQTSPVDPRSADIRIFDQAGWTSTSEASGKLEGLFFRKTFGACPHYEMGRIVRREDQADGYVAGCWTRLDLESLRPPPSRVVVDYTTAPRARCLRASCRR